MKKIIILSLFLLVLLMAHFLNFFNIVDIKNFLREVRNYSRTAPFIFILIYVFAVVFIIPSAPLNLFAGVIFGGALGGFVSIISTTLGSIIAFYLSRYLFGARFTHKTHFTTVNKLMTYYENHPWIALSFIRINPVAPTCILNYIIGATKIAFRPFFITTLIIGAPPTIAFAYIGRTISSMPGNLEAKILAKKLTIILFLGSFILLIIPFLTKRILKKYTVKEL